MTRRTAWVAFPACVLLMLTAPPVAAGTFYVGVELGESSTDLDADALDDGTFGSIAVDDSDSAWKAFLGYRFLKFAAIEAAQVNLGEFSLGGVSSGGGRFPAGQVDAAVEADGYTISALGVLPLGQRFKVFARAGYFIWDVDFDVSTSGLGTTVNESDDGEDMVYGAGVAYRLGLGVGLRLEYEEYELGDETAEVVSGGVTWRF